VLYASHTIWQSHAEFEAWTRSEAFRECGADRENSKQPNRPIRAQSG